MSAVPWCARWRCLLRSLRRDAGPVLFLFLLCTLLGAGLLWLGAWPGLFLLLAGGVALLSFALLGLRGGCGVRL